MPPTAIPDPVREQLIDEAMAVFQPRSSVPLTREDGREFLDDLTGLFDWLLEQRAKQPVLPPRPAERRDPSAPPPPPPEAQAGPRKEPRPRRRASRQE